MYRESSSAYERVMRVSELRDNVMKSVGSTAVLCRLRPLSHSTARYVDYAFESLCSGSMLLSKIFPNPRDASQMLRDTGTLVSGMCIRQLMHTLDCTPNFCELLVSPGQKTRVLLELLRQGFRLAHSNGDLAQYEREVRGLSDEHLLFVGGPNRGVEIAVVVATVNGMHLFLLSPLLRNMQAFDGVRFVDLYPALGLTGPANARDDVALWQLTYHDLRLFVPRAARLGSIIPPNRAITVVHRYIGDSLCFTVPSSVLPRVLSRNSWDVRLHAGPDHLPGTRSWVILDAELLSNASLVHSYLQAPGLNFYIGRALNYAQSLIAMKAAPAPSSWDDELDSMIGAYRTGSTYPLACFLRPIPFRRVDIVFTNCVL